MFFDFYDDRPDYEALTREYVRLEDLLHLIIAVSVAFFLDIVAVIVMIYLASLPPSDAAKKAAMMAAQREPNPRFVFMSPAIDRQSKTASPRASASDANRRAAARERSPNPPPATDPRATSKFSGRRRSLRNGDPPSRPWSNPPNTGRSR